MRVRVWTWLPSDRLTCAAGGTDRLVRGHPRPPGQLPPTPGIAASCLLLLRAGGIRLAKVWRAARWGRIGGWSLSWLRGLPTLGADPPGRRDLGRLPPRADAEFGEDAADSWWSTVFGERKRRARPSRRCASRRRSAARTSSSRAVKLDGLARVLGPQGRAGYAARAHLAQPSHRAMSKAGRAPRRSNYGQRRARGRLVPAVGLRPRRLVGAAERAPLGHRRSPIPSDLQRERRRPASGGGKRRGHRSATASTPTRRSPTRGPAGGPARTARRPASAPPPAGRSSQACLGPPGRHRPGPLQVAGADGQLPAPPRGAPGRRDRRAGSAAGRARSAPRCGWAASPGARPPGSPPSCPPRTSVPARTGSGPARRWA